MILEVLRVAVPVGVVAYCVVTQAYMRMFFGTVMGALGAIALLVVATVHTADAIPVALAGAGSLVVGLALVYWGVDRNPA